MASETGFIVDAHIHVYAESHLSRLNWSAALTADHILRRQSSLDQYRFATTSTRGISGCILVEADRKSSCDEAGWEDALEEVAYFVRIARGKPIEGEGHQPEDAKIVLGIVPWAPVPAGPSMLEKYVSKIKSVCVDEQTLKLVKGFRYLVQDKPAGTMSDSSFIAGLEWLGERSLAFDLGVDLRSGGIHQLREACTVLDEIYCRGSRLKVIVNHLCKPNLRLNANEFLEHEDFVAWSECMERLARHQTTYMKLSGFFSELPPQDEENPTPIAELILTVQPWVEVALSAFGSSRVMFGSDWPVCSAGGPGVKSLHHWMNLVTALLDRIGLSPEEKQSVWSGTAAEAYGIDISKYRN